MGRLSLRCQLILSGMGEEAEGQGAGEERRGGQRDGDGVEYVVGGVTCCPLLQRTLPASLLWLRRDDE